MITPQLVYWITRLDNIQMVFGTMAILLGAGGVAITVAICGVYCNTEDKTAFKYLWLWIPILFVIAISTLIPSTKDAALIYMLPKIANSELVKEVPQDLKAIKDMAMDKLKDICE